MNQPQMNLNVDILISVLKEVCMNKLNVWTRQSLGVESIQNDSVLLIQRRFGSFNRESFRDAQTLNLFIHTS